MTTLSPLDVRFACTCSHASNVHPPFPVMKCEQCDCDGYRPAKSWRLGKVCEFSGYRLGKGQKKIVCPLCHRQTTVSVKGRVATHKMHLTHPNRRNCSHIDTEGRSYRCRVEPPTPAERFTLYVDKAEECWPWTGACDTKLGYGLFRLGTRQLKAHRYAWELENGPIPDGMVVCHHCDNPPWVRPSHLFLGTTLDNIRDKQSKGRQPKGAEIRTSKLTPQQVKEIRTLWPSVSLSALGAKYGVANQSIHAIVTGKTWRHV